MTALECFFWIWGLVYDTEPARLGQGSPIVLTGGKTWPLVVDLDGADDLNEDPACTQATKFWDPSAPTGMSDSDETHHILQRWISVRDGKVLPVQNQLQTLFS